MREQAFHGLRVPGGSGAHKGRRAVPIGGIYICAVIGCAQRVQRMGTVSFAFREQHECYPKRVLTNPPSTQRVWPVM